MVSHAKTVNSIKQYISVVKKLRGDTYMTSTLRGDGGGGVKAKMRCYRT